MSAWLKPLRIRAALRNRSPQVLADRAVHVRSSPARGSPIGTPATCGTPALISSRAGRRRHGSPRLLATARSHRLLELQHRPASITSVPAGPRDRRSGVRVTPARRCRSRIAGADRTTSPSRGNAERSASAGISSTSSSTPFAAALELLHRLVAAPHLQQELPWATWAMSCAQLDRLRSSASASSGAPRSPRSVPRLSRPPRRRSRSPPVRRLGLRLAAPPFGEAAAIA